MKKILQLLVLGIGVIAQAQTPIYHFTFDNTLSDTSNTVTFIKSPGVSAQAIPSYVPGETNSNALYIDGSSATGFSIQANMPNLPQGNSARTIMMRVKSSFSSGVETPYFHYGSTASQESLGLKCDSNYLTAFSGGSTNQVSVNPPGMNSSSFYLLTVTYDGTTVKMYRNTTLLASYNATLNTNGTNFKIGQLLSQNVTNSFVLFQIDDLKIYNSCLSLAQVSKEYVYNSDLNNGLVAFYDFENNLDDKTNNHNLSSEGTMSYSTGVEGGAKKAGSFTGNNLAFNTTLSNALNAQNYTICYWEKRISMAGTNNYASAYEAFGSQYARFYSGRLVIGGAYTATNYFTEINTQRSLFQSYVWKHNAITFQKLGSSTFITFYEDGYYNGSTNVQQSSNLYQFNNKFTIGGGTDVSGNFLASKFAHTDIDKFFVYNRVLDIREINLLKDQHEASLIFTSLSTPSFNQNNLKATLYPNPVNNILNIEIEREIKSVEIYNMQGQKVLSSNQKQVNVSYLANGIYMVRVEDENNSIKTNKIVKE